MVFLLKMLNKNINQNEIKDNAEIKDSSIIHEELWDKRKHVLKNSQSSKIIDYPNWVRIKQSKIYHCIELNCRYMWSIKNIASEMSFRKHSGYYYNMMLNTKYNITE